MRTRDMREEWVNALSHGLGIIFGVISLPILCYFAFVKKGALDTLPFLIYSFSFVFLFLASTVYHSSKKQYFKNLWKKVDHIAIYFMIAGSYTPFIFAIFQGVQQWIYFAIMWTIVLIGTLFKIKYTGRFENLSLFLYLSMGWMVIIMIKPFVQHLSILEISFVIAGGISYTSGVYFYVKDYKKYHHLIWHIFVLTGSILHFIAILLLLF